jgi:enolase
MGKAMSSDDSITRIHARQVLDSRGNPTVEAEVYCAGGCMGRAIVPSGASTGKHEAVELRDGDPSHFGGKGVRKAVANVRDIIAPVIAGMPASAQEEIDRRMIALDGTPNKSRLGANAILGVSLACAHAAAAARGVPLWQYLDRAGRATMPLPMVNMISGGLHAGGNVEFQDFLFLPIGARSYAEALEMTVAVYRALGYELRQHGYEGVLVGDEGGFGPKLSSNQEAVELIFDALLDAGMEPGRDAALALDVASSHFWRDGQYDLEKQARSSGELACDWLPALAETYPILSIEDGMAEDDWAGWKLLTDALGKQVQLIGDDLFVTNPQRLALGIERGVANSILIKLNQIGTLTETLQVIEQARAAGYRPVISARSGETEDSTIADLAVATGAGQIKIGSVARSERLAKYNQLLRIEEQMGPNAPFARWQPVSPLAG